MKGLANPKFDFIQEFLTERFHGKILKNTVTHKYQGVFLMYVASSQSIYLFFV